MGTGLSPIADAIFNRWSDLKDGAAVELTKRWGQEDFSGLAPADVQAVVDGRLARPEFASYLKPAPPPPAPEPAPAPAAIAAPDPAPEPAAEAPPPEPRTAGEKTLAAVRAQLAERAKNPPAQDPFGSFGLRPLAQR